MKNIGTRIVALLLLVWYSLSIIGFGVHTCSESNRSFLTNFISGVSCSDVHPSELCKVSCCSAQKHKKCCSHHASDEGAENHSDGGLKVVAKNCCHNDYQQIALTGSGQSNVSEQSVLPVSMLAFCSASSFEFQDLAYSRIIQARTLPDPGLCMGELRPLLSIWRI